MKRKKSKAFSLVELLVVLAIISIIGSFALFSFSQAHKKNQLHQMVEGIQSQAQLALQEAKTLNQPVVLIWWGDENRWPQGLQRGKIDNQKWIPLAKEWTFPEGVEFNLEEGYSTLLDVLKSQNLKGTISGFKKPVFRIIEFYPSGRINLEDADENLHHELTLTLGLKSDLTKKNLKKMIFYSISSKTGEFIIIDQDHK